jgi:hypothetical protein
VPFQPPQPQDNVGILIVVLAGTAIAVRYWRIAIPVIIVAILTLTILGLIDGLAAFYHLIR